MGGYTVAIAGEPWEPRWYAAREGVEIAAIVHRWNLLWMDNATEGSR
jgi:hypothetical protein